MSGIVRILLSNDDGIEAPGLRALEERLRDMAELWVVAPDKERSTTSHAMSLHSPIFMHQAGERRFAVEGLPADCVYLALHHLLPSFPALVISGINAGANLGRDVFYSGTAAAAREAALHGVRGLACSLASGDDFAMASDVTAGLVEKILSSRPADEVPLLLNLNIPAKRPSEIRPGVLGERVYPRSVEARKVPVSGLTYYWLGGPPVESQLSQGSDAWLIQNGYASLTPLSLDQTLFASMERTRALLQRCRDGH